MSPHKPHPPSRKIEVDLSGILIRPERLPTEVSHELESGTACIRHADWSIDPRDTGIGPSGWTNINFVAVSCLIALFCTVFIRDNFEYSRRAAHLPNDAADLRPGFNSTTAPGFDLEPSRLGADVQLDQTKMKRIKENAAYSNQSPAVSTFLPFSEDQALTLSRNTGIADRASGDNSNSARSGGSGPGIRSRTTSSNSESTSGRDQTASDRSSMRRLARHTRKSTISSQTKGSSNRQSFRRSLSQGVGNLGVGKSAHQATRQSVNDLKSGNHNGQSSASKTQIAVDRTVMSMQSMKGGMDLGQSHGAMNPMRMESGMLAQPAVGAGLGGINGNGFGGAGNHGGNARR